MAPYTFLVKVNNKTGNAFPVTFAGNEDYIGDGETSSKPTGPENNVSEVLVSKSGGTGGLFTLLKFWAGPSAKDVRLQFDIYCEMAASSGSLPRYFVGDCSQLSYDDFMNAKRAPMYYGTTIGAPGEIQFKAGIQIPVKTKVSHNGVQVAVTSIQLGYPNSHITLEIDT
ncbi:hypothetical protein B0T18DRAFT_431055 [Schizothecium vesticola]|uniref:Uncharacterized protein n=1 Tax=Schizothecium vesticola TaxID=314040 RepID=A0AA40K2X3_9PEZI|nr:hypothetical protein B0T18DRAFT_431055 [Schizothecium vesticola]